MFTYHDIAIALRDSGYVCRREGMGGNVCAVTVDTPNGVVIVGNGEWSTVEPWDTLVSDPNGYSIVSVMLDSDDEDSFILADNVADIVGAVRQIAKG